jgi:SlyX protein
MVCQQRCSALGLEQRLKDQPLSDQLLSDRLSDRVTELEIKASYTEDLIDQLDKVIVRQQEQIDLLIKTITELRLSSTDGGLGAARNLRDDLPPHF